MLAAKFRADQKHAVHEVIGGLLQNTKGDSIALLSESAHSRGECSEIRTGCIVAEIHEFFQRFRPPDATDYFQNFCRLLMIKGSKRPAYRVQADPVARPLIAEPRAPSSCALASSVRTAADAIRSSPGDLQNPGASLECPVQRNHFITHYLGVLYAKLREHARDPILYSGHCRARNTC